MKTHRQGGQMNRTICLALLLTSCEKKSVDELEQDHRQLTGRLDDLEALTERQESRITALEEQVATLHQQMSQTATPEQVAWVELVRQGLSGETEEDGTTLAILTIRQVDLVVEGGNLVVRSTDPDPQRLDGTGNLIVGWNRDDGTALRDGSNNLVLGDYHSYPSYGGLLTGYGNTVAGPYGAAIAGTDNTVTGYGASAVGGIQDQAIGAYAVTTGGSYNRAIGPHATVGGGQGNDAGIEGDTTNTDQHVSGGYGNKATGTFAAAVGGNLNAAEAYACVVTGGYNNTLREGASYGVIDCGTNNSTDDLGECAETVYVDD